MFKLNTRAACLYGLVAICTYLIACDDHAKNALKSELNKTNYNLVDPANDWTYAGGIAVYDTHNPKAGTAFYGLPAGVQKPQTEPATAAWGQDQIDSTFTAQALAGGLGTVVKLGFGFDHNKQTTLAQINASGARLPNPELMLTNPTVAAQIKTWLSGGRFNVYIVSTALTTTNLSAKTSSSTGVAAAFGDDVKQCTPQTGGSATGGNTTGGGSTAGGTSAGGTTTRTTTAAGSTATGAATSGTNTGPTVSVQVCKTDDSTFSLATQTPLVFATLTNAVTLQPDGTPQINPVPGVSPGGRLKQAQVAMPSGKWKQQPWPVQ